MVEIVDLSSKLGTLDLASKQLPLELITFMREYNDGIQIEDRPTSFVRRLYIQTETASLPEKLQSEHIEGVAVLETGNNIFYYSLADGSELFQTAQK